MKPSQKSLKDWTDQKWTTKSGKPSAKTGERYLPEAAIKSLSSAEYAATTKAKREGTKAGTKGGDAGEWSAREAQMVAKQYKAKGGGYK